MSTKKRTERILRSLAEIKPRPEQFVNGRLHLSDTKREYLSDLALRAEAALENEGTMAAIRVLRGDH